jgi:UDP-N-acetylglucosamine transferase subunit ALG13
VILVSTGTNGKPFDRLLRAVAELKLNEELVLQHGPSNIRPAWATCVATTSFDEFSELVRRARVVITHAGAGSVLIALAHARRPLVIPRLARFREAVDDHQLDFARRLDAAGLVTVAYDPDTLGPMLEFAVNGRHEAASFSASMRPDHLAADLGRYLREVVGDEKGAPRSIDSADCASLLSVGLEVNVRRPG